MVALILFNGSEGEIESGEKTSGLIKEVKPARPMTNVVAIVTPKPVDPNARPTKIGEILNGYVKMPSGRLHKIKGEITNDFTHIKGKYAIFEHSSDNQIAGLLSVSPGTPVMPIKSLNGNFTKDFLESLKHPIIVTKDDAPDVAELKRAVNEAKIELKAAYDRGEDIEQIVLNSRAELHKMALYKRDLQEQLSEMKRNKDITENDLELAFEAANKMLESKGISPTLQSPLTRQKMKMMYKESKLK